ncbi:MAG TPA: ankyrin repeat domain-containing protein [Phycisphaerae bacterium]|nr:ankyrin repeat domain-containing protein [Phycisphaerae bacterium]
MSLWSRLFSAKSAPSPQPMVPSDAKDEVGWTALMRAAATGDVEQVRALLAAGADKNASDANGITALQAAAGQGHLTVVQALVAAGVDLEAKDCTESTALQCALRQGRVDAVDALVAAGARIMLEEREALAKRKAYEASVPTASARLAPALVLRGHTGVVRCVGLSDEGFRAVSGGADRTLRIWNIYDGHEEGVIHTASSAEAVCYHEDGCTILAKFMDGFIRHYEASGILIAEVDGGGDATPPAIYGFARIPGTHNVIFGVNDIGEGRWGIPKLRYSRKGGPWETRWNEHLSGSVSAIAVHESAEWFVAADGSGRMAVWHLGTGNADPLYEIASGKGIRCLKTTGDVIVAGHEDGSISMWDTDGRRAWPDGPTRVLAAHEKSISSLDADGGRIVSGSMDNTLKIWDARSGDCLAVMEGGHSERNAVFGVAVRRGSGRRVVSAHADGTVAVWDTTLVR